MKKSFITTIKGLLLGVLFCSGMNVAIAGIDVTGTSSPADYTAGASNTFTFNVTLNYTGAEYVDRFQFVFPAGVTPTAFTPASGAGSCGSESGIATIAGQIVAFTTAGVPATGAFAPTGCGAYGFPNPLNLVFTVTADVAANFSGQLDVTLNSIGDGFLLPAGSVDSDVFSFAGITAPCVFTCPANVVVNLDPGACSAFVDYPAPTYTGDCSVPTLVPGSITQNNNLTVVDDALQIFSTPESHWRGYAAQADDFIMQSLSMASWSAGTVQIFVYTYTGNVGAGVNNLSQAQMTLIGQSNPTAVPGNAGADVIYNVALTGNVTIPAGSKFVIEQRKTAGGPWCCAGNYGGETAPSYISGAANGNNIVSYATHPNGNFSFISLIQRLNGLVSMAGAPIIVQTSGLPSGSEFPRGVTTNCFSLQSPLDGSEIANCCFDVEVKEYPNPISQLNCNDLVNISVDANCSACIGADDVLEGGPYGCYDDYIVELDKTLPYGNGPWVPACVGPSDIGKTYQVRVTDPENSNNRCWGSVKIEDKIAPQLCLLTMMISTLLLSTAQTMPTQLQNGLKVRACKVSHGYSAFHQAVATINWEYDDLLIEVCDGTYKIRREWTIIDWCIGDGFLYNQIIKVLDEEGPASAAQQT
jgi:hypothetical protein